MRSIYSDYEASWSPHSLDMSRPPFTATQTKSRYYTVHRPSAVHAFRYGGDRHCHAGASFAAHTPVYYVCVTYWLW